VQQRNELDEALLGLGRALTRYRKDAGGTAVRFISLTECLMWIRALDENIGSLLPSVPPSLVGLRLARNRSVHQLAAVTDTIGRRLPMPLPSPLRGQIVWLPLSQIPSGNKAPAQERAYETELAGKPVERTIQDALILFASVLKVP